MMTMSLLSGAETSPAFFVIEQIKYSKKKLLILHQKNQKHK